MRVLGFTSASTAGLLLLGTALATTRTTSSAASCGDQANDTSERKELTTFADTGTIANMRNMPEGTAATPHPPLISEYASFAAPAGVNGDTDKAQEDMPGPFGWLPRLMKTMDEATTWSGSSGIDTSPDFATSSANMFQEVPAGLRVDFHEEPCDEAGEGFRWTRFEQDSPPPPSPDQAFDRAFNALLYVCHSTNAGHIRALLYGSRNRRRRRRRHSNRRNRRNRRANSNRRRNRRLRRILRLTADVDRTLWGAWSQMVFWIFAVSPFFVGDGREEDKDGAERQMETRRASSPLGSNSAAAPAVLLPAPSAVPVAYWPQMADPSAVLSPIPPLALLTLLETPAKVAAAAAAAVAPWPPLSPFPPTAALGVDIAIPMDPVADSADASAAAAPLPPALPVEPPQLLALDAAMAVPLDASVDPLDAVKPLDAVDSLDAAKWSSVAKTLTVKDLHKTDRMVAPERGWGVAIEADLERLWLEPVAACPSELVGVRWMLTEAVRLYPFTGYTQGSEHAALAIYREMRADKGAALEAFVRWASPAAWLQRSTINGEPVQLQKGMVHSWKVLRMQSPSAHSWLEDETMDALYSDIFLSGVGSLCTCQGLPRDVVRCLIQKTLEAGKNGPAVSLWVMHCLLSIAESECKRKMDATPDLCVKTRLVSAGKTVASFEDLSRHAPMPLGAFLEGYEAAVFVAQTWCF